MATATTQSQKSSKRASSVKGKNVERPVQKEQLLRTSGWGTTFAGEMAPYAAPRGAVANFLFRWRLWFESTFVFTLLEPWEKGLLRTYFLIMRAALPWRHILMRVDSCDCNHHLHATRHGYIQISAFFERIA